MKLSERSIRIKELISGEVGMGTFGLVELELQAFDKEIAELKNCNLQNVTNRTCYTCKYCMYESEKPRNEQFSCFVSLDVKGITDPHTHVCKKWDS